MDQQIFNLGIEFGIASGIGFCMVLLAFAFSSQVVSDFLYWLKPRRQ